MRFTLTEADIDGVHRVKHCAERREYGRPKLEGVVVGPNHIAATDSYRMAFHPIEADLPEAVLLPNDAVNDLPVEGDCRMAFTAADAERGTLSFTVGGERVSWPSPVMTQEWSRIPGLWPHHVSFGRKNLMDALKLVAPRTKHKCVALHSAELPDRLFGAFGAGILGDHPETGNPLWVCAQPELVTGGLREWTGDRIPGWMPTVIVAQRFLVEMVRAVHADVVTVSSFEPQRSVWLRGEDDLLEQVLMPMLFWPEEAQPAGP